MENEGGRRREEAGSDRGKGEEKVKATGETEDRGDSKGAYRWGLQRFVNERSLCPAIRWGAIPPILAIQKRGAIPLPCDPTYS